MTIKEKEKLIPALETIMDHCKKYDYCNDYKIGDCIFYTNGCMLDSFPFSWKNAIERVKESEVDESNIRR